MYMNSVRLKSLLLLMMLFIAFGCQKDDEVPSYVVNNSVKPVDFLTDNNYTTLNIEVGYVEGYQPTPAALANLTGFLAQRLNKPANITITQRTIPATGRVSIDIYVIREIEKAQRKSVTSGKVLTAWIMFLDTEYSESTSTSKVLGIAYGASSMAVFEKTVYQYTQPSMPSRSSLETVIIDHEFGHILGLVNNGTPMISPHQDNSHGAHCSNTECLMYWKSEENIDLNDLFGTGAIPVLDANCLADLKAAGGK
jgi:hypothetical protein